MFIFFFFTKIVTYMRQSGKIL